MIPTRSALGDQQIVPAIFFVQVRTFNQSQMRPAKDVPDRPDQLFGGASSRSLARDLLEAWNAQRPRGVTDLPDLVQCIRKGELPVFFVQTTFPPDAPPQSDGLEGLLRWCMDPGDLAGVDQP